MNIELLPHQQLLLLYLHQQLLLLLHQKFFTSS